MCVAVKLLGADAVLHDHELDVRNLKTGLLHNFATQRSERRFVALDFAAGNAPFARPFVRANHQHFIIGVEDERADGRQRRLGAGGQRLEAKIIFLQHTPEFAEMFDDQVRLGGAQLLQRIVAGQHGAGMNTAMTRGLNVVLHVADEQCFVRLEVVLN